MKILFVFALTIIARLADPVQVRAIVEDPHSLNRDTLHTSGIELTLLPYSLSWQLHLEVSMFESSPNIAPGRYRHYKGQDYQVHFLVTHSETQEKLVAYQCLYGDMSYWVRPLTMFMETVEINGETVPRFKHIQEKSTAL